MLAFNQGCKPGGDIVISGELMQWHNVILTLEGPFAHESDTDPNPFTDYRMDVVFTHESGESILCGTRVFCCRRQCCRNLS